MLSNYKGRIHYFKYTTNKVLFQLAVLLFIAFFLIIRFCQYPLLIYAPLLERLFIPNHSDNTLYNISISYVAAYIFYLLQVYLPTKANHKKGIQTLAPYISRELLYINELILICEKSLSFESNCYTLKLNAEPFYYKISTDSKIYLYRFTYSNSYDNYKIRLQNIHDAIISNANLGLLDSSFLYSYSNIPYENFITFMDQVASNTIQGNKIYFSSIDILKNMNNAVNDFCTTYCINTKSEINTSVSKEERMRYEDECSSSTWQESKNAILVTPI